jgi:hypothetical protein
MDNKHLEDKKTALEMEREELDLLINRGFKFTVSMKVQKRQKGLRGLFGRKETAVEQAFFEIRQPTLDTLDRISAMAVDMALDEEEFKGGQQAILSAAWGKVKGCSRKMARVVAIAVLGEDYYVTEITGSGNIKRRKDDRELNRLTDLFLHAVSPSELAVIVSAITGASNLADFITSMRFLSGARTTQPIRESIE